MLLKIHPENPSNRQILRTCETLQKGGIIVYPTDSVYALGCDINQYRAVARIARLKGISTSKADFSFIFADLSQLSDYARVMDKRVFRLIKYHVPGPFTFILEARRNIPKLFQSKKKTVGIRIPDNKIALEIVRNLGHPIMTTSIHDEKEPAEYITDPELIWESYKFKVDIVIDGGYGKNTPTTVIDCTLPEPEIIRQGIGSIKWEILSGGTGG
jgi:tRNA threonylcarbamoyl adenosine modification protein (Sua5/YciO/YrdC/YwlC family)